MKARHPLPKGFGAAPAPASAAGARAAGLSQVVARCPPGFDPAGRVRVSDVWPLAATPLALAALAGAAECAALRTGAVAAEWGLGSLAVAAGQVAGDLVAAAVAASAGLAGEPVVRLWLRGDGRRMLVAVWDGRPEPPAGAGTGEWPYAGIAAECGWHEYQAGKACWAVLSWRDARPGAAGPSPGEPS